MGSHSLSDPSYKVHGEHLILKPLSILLILTKLAVAVLADAMAAFFRNLPALCNGGVLRLEELFGHGSCARIVLLPVWPSMLAKVP